jgi:hypothetical protein
MGHTAWWAGHIVLIGRVFKSLAVGGHYRVTYILVCWFIVVSGNHICTRQWWQHRCPRKAYKYEHTIPIITTTITGMIVKIMRTGATWWSTIELIVLTTSNVPGIRGTIGSGATSILTTMRDAKRDRPKVR